MMIHLRKLRSAVAVMALTAASIVQAQAWPTKPIRIIVPASAGTAPDNTMRLIADGIAAQLKRPVIIENKAGAGGTVAIQAFQSSKDDHTFLLAPTSLSAIAPLTFKSAAKFDFLNELQPVARLAQTPMMIVANPAIGARSLGDALRMARAKPGEVAFATPPQNTLANLALELLSQAADVKFNGVPFVRAGDSLAAVTNGDASFFIDGVSVVLPFVRSNRLQPIAVLSSTKLPGLEAYPLGRDSVEGLEVVGRFGLVTGKDVSRGTVDAMAKATVAALSEPGLVAKLRNLGVYAQPGGPDEYLVTLRDEIKLWGQVVRKAGIKPE